MKQGYLHVCVILDESASMATLRDDALYSLTEFFKERRIVMSRQVKVDFYLFAEKIKGVSNNVDLNEFDAELLNASYECRGATAFNDAFCEAVDTLGTDFARLPDSERPERVVVAVVTDGVDNCSVATLDDVYRRLEVQTSVYNWSFEFFYAQPYQLREGCFDDESALGVVAEPVEEEAPLAESVATPFDDDFSERVEAPSDANAERLESVVSDEEEESEYSPAPYVEDVEERVDSVVEEAPAETVDAPFDLGRVERVDDENLAPVAPQEDEVPVQDAAPESSSDDATEQDELPQDSLDAPITERDVPTDETLNEKEKPDAVPTSEEDDERYETESIDPEFSRAEDESSSVDQYSQRYESDEAPLPEAPDDGGEERYDDQESALDESAPDVEETSRTEEDSAAPNLVNESLNVDEESVFDKDGRFEESQNEVPPEAVANLDAQAIEKESFSETEGAFDALDSFQVEPRSANDYPVEREATNEEKDERYDAFQNVIAPELASEEATEPESVFLETEEETIESEIDETQTVEETPTASEVGESQDDEEEAVAPQDDEPPITEEETAETEVVVAQEVEEETPESAIEEPQVAVEEETESTEPEVVESQIAEEAVEPEIEEPQALEEETPESAIEDSQVAVEEETESTEPEVVESQIAEEAVEPEIEEPQALEGETPESTIEDAQVAVEEETEPTASEVVESQIANETVETALEVPQTVQVEETIAPENDEPQVVEQEGETSEPQEVESQIVEPETIEPEFEDAQAEEKVAADLQRLEPQTVEEEKPESETAESPTVEKETSEPEINEPHTGEEETSVPEVGEARAEEENSSEAQRVEPAKETEKAEAEPIKEEAPKKRSRPSYSILDYGVTHPPKTPDASDAAPAEPASPTPIPTRRKPLYSFGSALERKLNVAKPEGDAKTPVEQKTNLDVVGKKEEEKPVQINPSRASFSIAQNAPLVFNAPQRVKSSASPERVRLSVESAKSEPAAVEKKNVDSAPAIREVASKPAPIQRSIPQSGPASQPKPQPKSEPTPRSEPVAQSAPTPQPEPLPEPEPLTLSEPLPQPESSPTQVPAPAPQSTALPEDFHRSEPIGDPEEDRRFTENFAANFNRTLDEAGHEKPVLREKTYLPDVDDASGRKTNSGSGDDSDTENGEKKRGFFSRFFGKK